MWMRNLPQFLGFEEKMRVGYPIFGCGPLMTECDLLEAYAATIVFMQGRDVVQYSTIPRYADVEIGRDNVST